MRILVTGGTGSMGRTLVRRLLERDSSYEVVIFSRDEAKQFDMQQAYRKEPRLEFRIGDVRSYDDVTSAVRGVDTIIHAAALKQVPSCEYFPEQAILTNCIGMQNIVRAARTYGVRDVVTLSTDKACSPSNAMGMSKALQEKIWIAGNLGGATRFVGVRYGNVLSSRGSVVPLFQQQISTGGPVTITVPGMTRFLLTQEQAADTVFAALEWAHPGEIYVPKVPSARVGHIAEALIGERNISIEIIGSRPGEKLHEIMISKEEMPYTFANSTDGGWGWGGCRSGYCISPALPELRHYPKDLPPYTGLGTEYSSEHFVLDLGSTRKLLEAV